MPNTRSSSPLGLTLYSEVNNFEKVGSYDVLHNRDIVVKSLFGNNTEGKTRNQFRHSKIDNFDITTTSIITSLEKIPSMRLSAADFAYLTKLGVYPNNRLIVARRFEAPVADDLRSQPNMVPIATMVSWVKDNEDFLKFDYGESWIDSTDGSFRKILNDIGDDVMLGDNRGKALGDFLEKGSNAIPVPGFTEGLQYEVFKALGMTDLDSTKLPLGNPNLIREASRRSTVSKEDIGSGLKCKFEVSMEVEYEQKFISGIDPTTVYYDIIANALAFGTSESVFQFRSDKNSSFGKFLDDLGSGDNQRLKNAIKTFIGAMKAALQNIGTQIIELAEKTFSSITAPSSDKKDQSKQSAEEAKKKKEAEEANGNLLLTLASKTIAGIVSKYKIRIISVVNAMTGSPSGPWHVTIGNPNRPVLSCGDMICKSVNVTFGKVLAYNDLPSSMKFSFKLESARNYGLQEIFKKLSCGEARTYASELNFLEKRRSFQEEEFSYTDSEINQSTLNAQSNIQRNTPNNQPQPNVPKK